MKSFTPEISWHNREPVFSVDVQQHVNVDKERGSEFYRIATAGGDNFVVIWRAHIKQLHPQPSHLTPSATDDEQHIQTMSSQVNASGPSSVSIQSKNRLDQLDPNSKNSIELDVVSTLSLHIKSVNIAKFAPTSNLLASGGDDSYVYIWKLTNEDNSDETNAFQEDKERVNPFNDFDDQLLISKEQWKRVVTLRRHIEDVVDLAWSPDERFLITGSVDNMAMVWDVKKGDVLYTLNKHDGYVQGVGWDPLNQFVATMCTDRSLRFFNVQSKKLIAKLNKTQVKVVDQAEQEPKVKSTPIFYDDTLATISRRITFSPNGELLLAPSGIVELDDEEKDSDKFANVVHMFLRDNLKKIKCYIPTGTYSTSVKFCNQLFKLKPNVDNPFPFPYRMVFAIASKHSVLICDTQQAYPIAKVSDIHYTKLSDISWSSDGRILIVSSTDGYCTFIMFNELELGEPFEGEPYEFPVPVKEVSSPGQKKREKKEKEQEKEQPEPVPVVEKIPEAAKITNFFKKLPAGACAAPTPVSIRTVDQTNKTNKNTANIKSFNAINSSIKVNQIQVRRSGSQQVKQTSDPSATKQPRRISLITLMSNKPDRKVSDEVKENLNRTKSERIINNDHSNIIEEDVQIVQNSIDKKSSDIAKSVAEDETGNEQPPPVPPTSQQQQPSPSSLANWVLNSNGFNATDSTASKLPLTDDKIEQELNVCTPQRNKRKPESASPDELKPNAKKRISLTQIE